MLDEYVLKGLLTNPRESGSHFIADCVFCGKSGHFYINKGKNSKGIEHGFDCKKCQAQGNVVSFLKEVGRTDLLEGRQVDIKKIEIRIGKVKEDEEEDDDDIPDIKMPIGFKPCNFDNLEDKARNYLVNDRKFTKKDFELYTPGITKLIRKYEDYVLICIENTYSLKGFVGRYYGKDDNKGRYSNSKKTKFAKLLFGIDEVTSETETIILVEGAFDKTATTNALQLHDNPEMKCLATFGKKLSPFQLSLLRKTKAKNLIFLWDARDAINEIKKNGIKAKKYFNVYVGYTGTKDPNASTKTEIIKMLNTIETLEEFKRSKVQVPKLK